MIICFSSVGKWDGVGVADNYPHSVGVYHGCIPDV